MSMISSEVRYSLRNGRTNSEVRSPLNGRTNNVHSPPPPQGRAVMHTYKCPHCPETVKTIGFEVWHPCPERKKQPTQLRKVERT